jgi:hypothetical protein
MRTACTKKLLHELQACLLDDNCVCLIGASPTAGAAFAASSVAASRRGDPFFACRGIHCLWWRLPQATQRDDETP